MQKNCWLFTYTEIFGFCPFLCITLYISFLLNYGIWQTYISTNLTKNWTSFMDALFKKTTLSKQKLLIFFSKEIFISHFRSSSSQSMMIWKFLLRKYEPLPTLQELWCPKRNISYIFPTSRISSHHKRWLKSFVIKFRKHGKRISFIFDQ